MADIIIDNAFDKRPPIKMRDMGDGSFAEVVAIDADIELPNDLELTVEPGPNTGAGSSVASAASNTQLLASNVNRRGATVFNDSTAAMRLFMGAANASATVYSVKVLPQGYFELPYGYRGAVNAIWESANGFARITEFTLV